MTRLGWFADIDPDYANESCNWVPVLQLDALCLQLDVWHQSEADCLEFIRTEIIGKGELR